MSSITAGTELGGGLLYDSDTTGNLQIKTGNSAVVAATFHGNSATTFSGSVYLSGVSTPINPIISGTANTSISGGTVVPFSGIPSRAKRVTVMFSGVSTNGSSNPLVQIGTGGAATTSGYSGSTTNLSHGGSIGVSTYSTGFGVYYANAANYINGHMILTQLTGNQWVASYTFAVASSAGICTGAGNVTLAGALDYLRVTTVNGTDTFDAGSINIMWE